MSNVDSALDTIIKKNVDGIAVLNQSGAIVFVNPAAEELLGRPAPDILGQPLDAVHHADGAAEIDISRPDGEVRRAEIRISAIDWEGVPARLVALRDVTVRRQIETEREQLLLNQARIEGALLTAREIAHLLNNDISIAFGTIDILRNAEVITPQVRTLIEAADTGLSNAAKHLAQLQQIVRIEIHDTPIGPSLDLKQSSRSE